MKLVFYTHHLLSDFVSNISEMLTLTNIYECIYVLKKFHTILFPVGTTYAIINHVENVRLDLELEKCLG